MYYYAYVNSDNIVTGVYALPTEMPVSGYIPITEELYTNGDLVGKVYNPETGEFTALPEWIGSTDEVKYKQTNTILSDKLDAMDEAIANANAGADGATFTPSVSADGVLSWTNDKGLDNPVSVNIKGATGEQGIQGDQGIQGEKGDTGATGANGQDGKSAYQIALDNGFSGSETEWLASLKGDKGDKGDAGESGTSASITADEVLNKIKAVDGAGSGLDADTLDGVEASGFATADHTHSEYATVTDLNGKADTDHTHSNYATTEALSALETVVDGKANAIHTHSGYASTGDIETLQTAINGKASLTHTHNEYALASHTHSNYASVDDVESIETALSGKANSAHTHAQSDITGLSSALNGKANTNHTHSDYVLSDDFEALSDDVDGKASAVHTHSQSDITGLATTLAGKASTSHTHTLDNISETTAKKIMTAAERTKLSGIETGANKYTHPSTHSASMITGLSSVATSGKYEDLKNKPTIPTVPASLPANGGNADTVDNKHASDFATANHTHTAAEIGAATEDHTHSQYATLSAVYPVGSIYLSVNSVNPSTLFGGTWVAFGAGRVLMGVKSGGSAGATGGSETATIAAHTHTTASHKLTIEEMPTHHHDLLNYNENGSTTVTFTNNSVEAKVKKGYSGNVLTGYSGGNQSHSHGNTGSAGATTINVVQPYITCYMWKRTS